MEQSVRLPAAGAITGWAACRLHGGNFFDGLEVDGATPIPVPLNVGPHGNIRADAQVRACFHQLSQGERATRFSIPTVTPERATYDAMRLAADPREAVVAIDMMAAAELVSIQMLRDYLPGDDATCTWALDLASEHALSPNEVRLRMIWVLDAGLEPPLVNCPVYDLAGRLLGVVDLLDERAGMAAEFDGADHRTAGRQTADVRKEARLRQLGLEMTRVTGMELPQRSTVAERLHEARGRASFTPPAERLWVARPPAGDLHQRIQEREALRELNAAVEAQGLPDIRELRGY